MSSAACAGPAPEKPKSSLESAGFCAPLSRVLFAATAPPESTAQTRAGGSVCAAANAGPGSICESSEVSAVSAAAAGFPADAANSRASDRAMATESSTVSASVDAVCPDSVSADSVSADSVSADSDPGAETDQSIAFSGSVRRGSASSKPSSSYGSGDAFADSAKFQTAAASSGSGSGGAADSADSADSAGSADSAPAGAGLSSPQDS